MSDHPLIARLTCLCDVFAPAHVTLVGAGNGASPWAQWLLQNDAPALLLEADPAQYRLLEQRLNTLPANPHRAAHVLLAPEHSPEHSDAAFYTTSLPAANGLLPPVRLTSLWPNLHTVHKHRLAAVTLHRALHDALTQHGIPAENAPLWLFVDCLPAAPLLTSAGAFLPRADLILARVVLPHVLAQTPLPTRIDGASLDELRQQLSGMQQIALHPTRHPAIAHALFVRDYRATLRGQTQTALAAQNALQQQRQAKADVQRELNEAIQAASQAQQELETRLTQQQKIAQTLQTKLHAQAQANNDLQTTLTAEIQAKIELQSQLAAETRANADLQTKWQELVQAHQALAQHLTQHLLQKTDLDAHRNTQAEALSGVQKRLDASLKKAIINVNKQTTATLGLQHYLETGDLLPIHVERTTWPVSADFAWQLVTLLMHNDYHLIIEFGSGLSTLVLARTLANMAQHRHQKIPAFVSFDHLEQYAQQTRAQLVQAGLQQHVQLHHAPLGDWQAPDGNKQPYYTCQPVLAALSKHHPSAETHLLVVVDGPPAATSKHARYPAWPLVATHFPDAQIDILMDDTIRADEKEIVARWEKDIATAGLRCTATHYALEKEACLLQIRKP